MNIAYPAVLAGTLLGGSSGLFIKALPYSSPALSAFRMGVPFLFFLPLMIRRGIVFGPPAYRKKLWTGSLLNAMRMVLYILAFKLTTLANAVVLLYLWPLFALLIDTGIRREKIKGREAGLLLLAIAGVIMMNLGKGFSFSISDLAGSVCMILSALMFSITALIFKEALKDHSEGEVLYFQNALGGILSIPFLLFEMPAYSVGDFGMGVVYGLVIGVVAFGCFFVAMKRLPIFQYGALTYIEVIFGVSFGIIFLGEQMSLVKAAGMVLILTASVLSRIIDQKGSATVQAERPVMEEN